MQTARDDRAGKFICHGLRRFIIGGRLHLVDINAVAVTLGVDDARGKLRRELFIRQDEVESQRNDLISQLELQLQQHVKECTLFTIEWELI